jgi:hypothetical protein
MLPSYNSSKTKKESSASCEEKKVSKNTKEKKRDSIFVVIFENNSASNVITKSFFGALSRIGTYLSASFGITEPSQVNYWAMSSGSTFEFYHHRTDDPVDLPFISVFNLLEKKGVSWRVYLEGFPGSCFSGPGNICVPESKFESECVDAPWYVRKHNPGISYNMVRDNPAWCKNLVNAAEMQRDLLAGTLPEFAFYIPSQFNDAHDTNATWANEYLLETWGPLLRDARFMKDRIVLITFDENGLGQTAKGLTLCTANQQVPIYTLFLGPNVENGKVLTKSYNHYNVLRTVENWFSLGTLGRCDTESKAIKGFFKKEANCAAQKEKRLAKFIRRIEKATIEAATTISIPIARAAPMVSITSTDSDSAEAKMKD